MASAFCYAASASIPAVADWFRHLTESGPAYSSSGSVVYEWQAAAGGAQAGRLVPETFKPMLGEAPTPFANRVGINSQAGRHDLALLAFSTGQDDPSPQRQRLRRAPARRQRRQLGAFHLIEPQRGKASTHNRSSPKSGDSAMFESIWSPSNFRFRTLGLRPPELSRCDAEHLTEMTRKMAWVGKAHGVCNLRQ